MSEEKVKGKVTALTVPTVLKTGQKKDKSEWILRGCKITVGDKAYSITDFSGSSLKDRLGDVKIGDDVEFTAVENDSYWNVLEKTKVTVLKSGPETVAPAPQAQIVLKTQTELVAETIEVTELLKLGLGVVPDVDILNARLKVFEELCTDNRTKLIQSYKR